MKNKFIYSLAFVFAATLVSCSGEKETEEKDEETAEVKKEVCTYSYDNTTTVVQWTAYKFTEKSPVQGKFDTIIVTGDKPSEDAMEVINGATFQIKTASTQTNDAEKNGNIIAAFFGKMLNTVSITGTVKSVKDGKATISIKMNDVEKDVEGLVVYAEDKLSFKADISLDNWNGQAAIKSLNEKCKKNHTGTDGKLYVAPDVTLYVETTLKKECK